MSYCNFVGRAEVRNSDFLLHEFYHNNQYGFPIEDDNELFGRLLLEINQAGLSWTLMLRKQESFRAAYSNYEIDKVAAYEQDDIDRLLGDPGIVRNRLKVNAAVHNARVILDLQKEFGSFKKWLEHHHPKTKEEWVKIFKKTFRFTGGEIVNEFLMSTGYLPGAHSPGCPVYDELVAQGVYK